MVFQLLLPVSFDAKSNYDHAQAQQLVSTICAVCQGQSSDVMPMSVGDTQNCIADVQSLVVYSATNPSLPPSVAQISAIDVDSDYFLRDHLQAGRGPGNHRVLRKVHQDACSIVIVVIVACTSSQLPYFVTSSQLSPLWLGHSCERRLSSRL